MGGVQKRIPENNIEIIINVHFSQLRTIRGNFLKDNRHDKEYSMMKQRLNLKKKKKKENWMPNILLGILLMYIAFAYSSRGQNSSAPTVVLLF